MEINLEGVRRKKVCNNKSTKELNGLRKLWKTGEMERVLRNGTVTILYTDGARPLVLRQSAENPEIIR